jgi:pseudouridine kinase
MTNLCVFCGACTGTDDRIEVGSFIYWDCPVCGGIALERAQCLPQDAERDRYTLHENTLENMGYRRYLESFLDAVLAFPAIVRAGVDVSWKLFDYGSGPEPALVSLMRARGFEARGWDPYFAPETERFSGGADLVTCLEVAEHFKEPIRDFALLAECARPGGFIAVGTHLLDGLNSPQRDTRDTGKGQVHVKGNTEGRVEGCDRTSPEAFASWWYRQDRTHVSFYARKTLSLVATHAGLAVVGEAAPNVVILRKEDVR